MEAVSLTTTRSLEGYTRSVTPDMEEVGSVRYGDGMLQCNRTSTQYTGRG
jgi:hypothetical protein